MFAYHGYPWLIHRLTYRRTNHPNLHVRGYKEEGTTTTPFDMVMLNDLDRFHLVIDVIDRVPGLGPRAGHVRQLMVDKRIEARAYTRLEGEDAPEIANWTWPYGDGVSGCRRDRSDGPRGSSSSTRGPAASSCGSSDPATRVVGDRGPARAARRRPTRELVADAIRGLGAGRRRRPPDRPRRDGRSRARSASTTRRDRAARGAHRPRAAPPAEVAGRARGRRRPCSRTCRPSPASTPPSTRRCRPPPRPTRSRPSGASAGRCAGTASTGSRTPTRRGGPRSCALRPDDPELRIVTCHLGAGASLAAVLGGRSVDTTMGFTPLEGLVMATRSGSVDPGLVLWLAEARAACRRPSSAATLEHRSGLLGLAGTADMRAILAGAAPATRTARLALDVYLHRLRGAIAAMVAALGGLDVARVHRRRRRAGAGDPGAWRPTGSGFLGVAVDPARNADAARATARSARPARRCARFVIPAREDVEIAREVRGVLAAS